ncbi:MAG: hypothetical protein AB7S75_16390 [Desulfococcaceae bacterium]
MLIHIRHAENRESVPDSLVFAFEEPSLRHRLGKMARRVSGREYSGKEDESPVSISIAKKDHVFAALPLNAGPSFCLHMPDAARSELHLIISPLNSLERNPEIPLKINSPVRESSLHIHHKSLTLGRIRLLYISPESLISRSLREDLYAIVRRTPVCTLIIDKAYCISEWGPEFRPAYLRLPQIISDLEKQNPDLTVLALSSISGEMIRKDVPAALKLKDISPRQRKNFCRDPLSFQVITVNSPEEKKRACEEFISGELVKLPVDKEISDPPDTFLPQICQTENLAGNNNLNPHDDPEICLQGIPDLLVSTGEKGEQKKKIVRLYKNLADSPEIWMLHAGTAGSCGCHVHSVRITHLPCAACENDMHKRRTRIPDCSETGCPFEKTLCDYGRQHIRIRHQYPDAVQEIMTALHMLDILITAHKAGENPLRIPLSAFRQRDAEKALFRLAVIRLIDRFSLEYREGEPVFKVYGYRNFLAEDAAHAGIMNYLRSNDISANRRFDFRTPDELLERMKEIERCRDMHAECLQKAVHSSGLSSYREYEDFFLSAGICLIPVVCHVQDEMRNMAYYRLWHLKEMIMSRGCRYSALLKNLQTSDEDWKCGRCDCCAPDLHFDPASLSRPPESWRLAELEERFSQWMENREIPFDAVSADRLIQDFGDFYDNLIIRSRRILEHNPRNIKALYVLRELAPDMGKAMHTADLMQVAVMDMKTLQVIRFYETSQADTSFKPSMFAMMDNEYGNIHTPDGEQWLYREALNLNLSSPIIEILEWRVMLNLLSKTVFPSRNTRLNQLLKEF